CPGCSCSSWRSGSGSGSGSSRVAEPGFRFLEHTADLRVECHAPSLESLLDIAARALYSAAFTRPPSGTGTQHAVAVHAPSREELLVRWLQELIFLMDARRFAASSFEFHEVRPGFVSALAHGAPYTPDERDMEIKAATYHDIEIVDTPDGLIARIVFDL
ncbi:MAG: archease, partial [Candidatus Hydrogenedentes bacterium]|nr:archease [Candidatus Hydrogenedentota bacterium]